MSYINTIKLYDGVSSAFNYIVVQNDLFFKLILLTTDGLNGYKVMLMLQKMSIAKKNQVS